MNAPFKNGSTLTPEEALRQLELMSASYAELSETLNEKLTLSATQPVNGSLSTNLTEDIRDIVLSVLKLDKADFSPTTPLMDYGLDSIAATEIGNLFTSRFNIVIPPTVFFEFPDLKSFVNYLTENYASELQATYPESAAKNISEPSIVKSMEASPANAAVVIPINKTVDKQQIIPQANLTSQAVQIDGSMNIESLWQMTEVDADPVVINGTANLNSLPSFVPDAPVAAIHSQASPEVRQPSRELLNSMKAYADRALIHTITRAGKRRLEYATYGEGPPLLMLGGLLMHYSVMWLVNMKELGEHHKLIMFHMPGCGGLELHEDMTLESIADDIADVLDAQGITESLSVFGCSFGGVLAQAFALAYPERCSALAITVSTPFAEGATDFQLLMKELQVSPRFMELNRGWPMASLPAYEKVIEGFDFREHLKKLDIPSLIVAGGQDRYTTPEFSSMMADSLYGSQLVQFPDAGHLLTFSHHEEFNRLLIDFLATVTSKESEEAMVSKRKASAFLPATQSSLDIIKSYIENGQQGHCVILSEHAAQLALTLNVLCNQDKTEHSAYRSYFLTSLEEAFDAAIRLARHHERNKNPKSSGGVLIIDQSQRWLNYFNPLKQGQADELVPGIQLVSDLNQAEDKLKHDDFAAVAFVANSTTPIAAVERFIAELKERNALSILLEIDDHNCDPGQWISRRIAQHPDLMVFGEGISGFQAPVGAMLVNESVTNPWLMTPSEGYVRQPMASFGLTVKLAFEYLSGQLADVLTPEQHHALRQIAVDQESTYKAHLQYGNIGYAKVANMHGFDARFFEAHGLRSRVVRKGEPSREIIDCLANVGSAPRGLNPQDVASNVVQAHNPQHDYWDDLAQFLKEKTGFAHTLPSSSQTTAIESALTLAHMAAPHRKKMLCFIGGAGFSLLSANSAMDTVFDLFRKPFQPLYPYSIFIDPASENAADELEKELLSGELAFVWLETIQVEGNAVRPLPQHLIDLINRHRTTGGYLVALDETQTSVGTGKFLHSEGLVDAPDIVALAMSLSDSIFPIGAVLTTDKVMQIAEKTNALRLNALKEHSANQLSADIALNSLQQIYATNLMQHAMEMGTYLKRSLQDLAQSFPLIRDVRGEGLVLAVEFDLAGYDAFIQQSFGYFLWGAMLRDEEYGVALVVCPIHNRSIRVMPPLTISRTEIDIIVANLRRRMAEGVEKIIEDCAAYSIKRGDRRLAEFLSSVLKH
jgi:acetylornithine/succinyldiaminopimelate/putrescine aminotransferase/pimeloyl-ACP methyl ester carboxylesterase/acyl carrier protein